MKKRLHDLALSVGKKCRGCNDEEGPEKLRLHHCPSWREVRNQISDGLGTWEQRAKRRGDTGNGEEVSCRILCAEVLGGKATCQSEGGSLKKQRNWAAHCKDYGTMSPPMSLAWESQARGVRVGGQWCGFIMKRRWGPCMGCTDR